MNRRHIALFFLSLTLGISGCRSTFIPIKGSYGGGSHQVRSDHSREEVWNRIVELFAVRGLAIKFIDKPSGLIIAERGSFLHSSTQEWPSGELVDPKAAIVYEKLMFGGMNIKPDDVTAEWNIRIAEEHGTTLINVNLVNIEVVYRTDPPEVRGGRSTGEFEQSILDYLK